MSVLFKRVEGTPMPRYQIVITLGSSTDSPEEDLQYITSDIIDALRYADISGRSENFNFLLQFLEELIPDRNTYAEMKGGNVCQ